MLDILHQLLVVQDRDRRIAQLTTEAARVPGEIAGVEKRVAEESARLESARQELKHVEADRKKLEIDADSKRAQITKYRTQLNLIKSNTEYQALLKEIARAEVEIRKVEDEELEFMMRLDQLQPLVKQEQVLLKEVTAKGETEKSDLKKRAAAIENELAQLRAEREKLVANIDADALTRYERLLRSKGDIAIVPVQHGNCGGCHLHLPPQVAHDSKNGSELTSCSYCGRILYWQRE
jgi:predicted  nucleic acid-binding Zn-ribbon protein